MSCGYQPRALPLTVVILMTKLAVLYDGVINDIADCLVPVKTCDALQSTVV